MTESAASHDERALATADGNDPAVRDAIARYHEGLSDDVAAASQEMLARRLRDEGLYFGDRPLCSVLRPRFLSYAQYRHITRTSELVVRGMERVRVAAMQDASLRAQFRLLAWEEALIHADPRLPVASPVSRLDAFFAPGAQGLKYTEYNAETPAGAAYNDVMARVFLDLPAMGAFRRTYVAVPLPAAPGQVQALLEGYHHWRGVREVPQVCILDWREVPTYSEFVLYQHHLEAAGVPTFIGDPRDAEYANGRLTVGGRHVTLIYKRVLIDELVERCGVDSPVVRAVRDGAACMINPFRCKLLHKKASLAVVSDERNQSLLAPDERAAIAAHVPWTRVVEERHTVHDGQPIDLLPYVAARREQFVLKPNDEYGGKGIVLGWTVSETEWQAALQTAVDQPYIVQERIALPSTPYPAWVDGRLHIGERMEDTAPFLVNGQAVDGCLSRIATDPLLNVTAGGGSSIPSFLVEAR